MLRRTRLGHDVERVVDVHIRSLRRLLADDLRAPSALLDARLRGRDVRRRAPDQRFSHPDGVFRPDVPRQRTGGGHASHDE
jgi:hypothetical protein